MNKEKFIEELEKLGLKPTLTQMTLLDEYYHFLVEYNAHTNLTAITKEEDVYLKHFYDSLTITKAIDLNSIESLIDVGTGAGFPGIVLKIFYPHLKLTLLDSNNKKIKFLNELVLKLNLNDAKVVNERAEDYAKNNQNKYDLCVSRAVAFMDIISSLTLPFSKNEGMVILMKGEIIDEKRILMKHQKELFIKDYNIINFKLPNDDERNLVCLKKENNLKLISYNQLVKRNKNWKQEL